MELNFFRADHTLLCFGFVTKTVLITHHCFSYHWEVLAQCQGFLFFLLRPPQQQCRVNEGCWIPRWLFLGDWVGISLLVGDEWFPSCCLGVFFPFSFTYWTIFINPQVPSLLFFLFSPLSWRGWESVEVAVWVLGCWLDQPTTIWHVKSSLGGITWEGYKKWTFELKHWLMFFVWQTE